MKKETLIAVVLTIAVWVLWFMFFMPDPQQETLPKASAPALEQQEQTASRQQTPAANSISVSHKKDLKEIIIPFETKNFKGEFSSKGGVIANAELKGLKEENVPATVFDSELQTKGCFDFAVYFNSEEFLEGSELNDTVWSVSSGEDGSHTFSASLTVNEKPLEIQKKFVLAEDGDSFNLEYTFFNRGGSDMQLPGNSLIFSPADMLGPKLDYENRYNAVQNIVSVNGSYDTVLKNGGEIIRKEEGSIDWAGIASRYILLIMLPREQSCYEALIDNRENRGFRIGIASSVGTIKAGSSVTRAFTVYLGPKDKDKLALVDKRLKSAADISTIIEPIRYFVIWSLLKINSFVGNMGWSLIVFSILTKIVFMPLTNKSTKSMKKMQELSPKINALREKYKAKPDIMQREIMTLYKENKVNPMGGCLPLLVQMPFFFALYSALINSIDLWHAPFILWMKDLSMPDTLFTVGGFNVNVLPFLMTGTTFIQQKISTVDTGQSKAQKMMIMLMPLIFIFIFWTIPSGLVLYWTLQNIFQIANQLIVNRLGKTA